MGAKVYKYRLWCVTESAYVYSWVSKGSPAPSTCPNDTSHTVDVVQTAIVEKQGDGPANSEGVPYFKPTPGKTTRSVVIKGATFSAPLGATTAFDFVFSEERELQGASAWVTNYQAGDYAELEILAPDNTLLGKFGETVYVPPDGVIPPIASEGSTTIPLGYKVRIEYTAIASGVDRTCVVHLRTRK